MKVRRKIIRKKRLVDKALRKEKELGNIATFWFKMENIEWIEVEFIF